MAEKNSLNAFRVLLLSVFMAMVGLGIISPIIPNYASDLGATGIYIGLIYSSFSLSRAILQTPIGRLADRYNRKNLLITGGLIASAGYIYMVQTSNLTQIFLARIIVSIGGALSLPAVNAIIAEEGKEYGSGSTVGVFNTAMSIGQIIGPVFSGLLLDLYGMGSVFYFSGIISFISVLAFWLLSRS